MAVNKIGREITDAEIYKKYDTMTIGEFLNWVQFVRIEDYVDKQLQQIVIVAEKRKTFRCAKWCGIILVAIWALATIVKSYIK